MSSRPEAPPGLAKWLQRGIALGLLSANPDERVRGRVAYRLAPKTSWRTAGPRKLTKRVLLDAARAQPDRFTVFRDQDNALWFVDETGIASDPDD